MSRFVLTTLGSLGDLHPYLVVAIGLHRRGHDVVLAASEIYRQKVEAEGVLFRAVRPDIRQLAEDPELGRRLWNLREGPEYVVRKLVLPHLAETYEDLLAASHGADLLVSHALAFATPLVAEKLKLPWVSAALQPMAFMSSYDPPVLAPAPYLYRLRHLGHLPYRLLFSLVSRQTKSWMEPVHRLRKDLGLPPSHANPMLEGSFSPFGTLAWFSSILGEPQPDWPSRTTITGFPFYDRDEPGVEPDRALEQFLASSEPPVVFTLGSSATMDARDFFSVSLAAARRAGTRALLVAGRGSSNLTAGLQPDRAFVAEYAPYSTVLPRAAATVHQGGIGTTAQALRAGRPMLVVPHGFDQPDNAERVRKLGVSRTIARENYTMARVSRELTVLLEDPSYSIRSAEMRGQILGEDGVEASCDKIEEIVRESRRLS